MVKKPIKAAIEVGKRKTFASAVDWPGWSRAGKGTQRALQSLLAYGDRYQRALAGASIDFSPPNAISEFNVVEEGQGNATTDFGAPDLIIESDYEAVSAEQHDFYLDVLRACWQAFDVAVDLAGGKSLRKGPRGGGRDLEAMVEHIMGADESYLYRIGWKPMGLDELAPEDKMPALRSEIMAGLAAKIAGELPDQGPRGGMRWPAHFFVRRVAWHVLDHAWEIEDRLQNNPIG